MLTSLFNGELYAPRIGIPASGTVTYVRLLARVLTGKFSREHYVSRFVPGRDCGTVEDAGRRVSMWTGSEENECVLAGGFRRRIAKEVQKTNVLRRNRRK
ncbi:MAG: hypothetical protein KAT56_02930 [Sedimentisphaerales bacterium]|nr:hypothetical protein [Sedimentisphaerales bacterium]